VKSIGLGLKIYKALVLILAALWVKTVKQAGSCNFPTDSCKFL